jgi:peptidyl-prolyl cis-trans isomerase A (cyclophilin A)
VQRIGDQGLHGLILARGGLGGYARIVVIEDEASRFGEITSKGQFVAEQLFATLKTNQGDIRVELYPNHAPKTVANFVELAEGSREWTDPRTGEKTTDKLYDGTVFHRVIPNFMIQAGDPLGTGTGGPGYRFADEPHPELTFSEPYILAMANAGPNTNGSQFFITVANTDWLNTKHTIFGKVADTDSRSTVDKIASTSTAAQDRPTEDIIIETVVVERIDG